MILFVDAEHVSGYDKPWGQELLANRAKISYRLQDISGDVCLLQRYPDVDPDLIRDHAIRAMFISGSSTDPRHYDPAEQEGVRQIVKDAEIPIFGFCGGWQLMADSLGSPIEMIGPLEDGEEDPNPDFMPGWKTEVGYDPVVSSNSSHPVLNGLGESPIFRQFHGWEIKTLPAGFRNYARTPISENQLVVNDETKQLGTQFHPEYYTDEHPAGRTLIENFCSWAGLI